MSFPCHIARHPWTATRLFSELRSNAYDLAIDACPGSNSGQLILAAARARHKIGFADSPTAGCSLHMAKLSVCLLRTAYAGVTDSSYPPLTVELAAWEKARGERVISAVLGGSADCLNKRQPVIGIFANASGAKRFPELWWTGFITELRTRRPDIRLIEMLAEHGQSQLGGGLASFYSSDLRKMAAVLASMQGFVSADCGVMHLAAAVGTPTLGLFALANSSTYAPYGGAHSIIQAPIDSDGSCAVRHALDWIDRAVATFALAATDRAPAKS